jgi:hypothetical protein
VPWVGWLVAALVAASVVAEVATGFARVRGVGRYARSDTPRAYWLVVLAKTTLSVVILVITELVRRGQASR